MLALIPTPKMEHLLARIKDAKYFLSIDLGSGYHHIPIAKADRHKSAFTCFLGKFELTRASFGIATCPDYLKALMN